MRKRSFTVLFLPQTTPVGASSRARIYAYLPEFEKNGYSFSVHPAASAALDSVFLRRPNLLQKIRWFLAQIFGRLGQIPKLRRYDCVYLHRETLPYFFPFTELLLRRFAKRLIFDFDDAVFYYPKRASRLKQMLMDRNSANRIIAVADRVIVSTPYLAEHAQRFNKQVICIPTGVRFADYKDVKPQKGGRTVIGWIGSASTQHYIAHIAEPLKRLAQRHDFVFRVVGAHRLNLPEISVEILPWSLEKEVQDIASFTIGVMPLPDDPWTRGKAGYKLIQYMAAGVPAVGSRVGANCDIIEDGVNGFLASTNAEWYEKLERLIVDADLRERFSERGRQTIREKFSIERLYPLWLEAVTKW
ncbi:MAG: glycosyltransferase family 4 protein [candidate division KSB1 bacterium]|nr:glycosyltransferase family 4 protein [candidate division KSB1 bacterium]